MIFHFQLIAHQIGSKFTVNFIKFALPAEMECRISVKEYFFSLPLLFELNLSDGSQA